MQEFPEADRAEWFDLAEARIKITRGQVPIMMPCNEDSRRLAVSRPQSPANIV